MVGIHSIDARALRRWSAVHGGRLAARLAVRFMVVGWMVAEVVGCDASSYIRGNFYPGLRCSYVWFGFQELFAVETQSAGVAISSA